MGKKSIIDFFASLLDDSYDARKARAEDLGYNSDVYHGTAEDISEFKPSMRGENTKAKSAHGAFWFVDDPSVAGGYARMAAEDLPVQRLIDQSYAAERAGDWDAAHNYMAEAEKLEQGGELINAGGQNILPLKIRGSNLKEVDADFATMSDLDESQLATWVNEAKSEGYEGLKITNFSDNADWGNYTAATHYAIFDPKNIRSVNAAFDPAKKDSANLLASATGAAVLGAMGSEETEAGTYSAAVRGADNFFRVTMPGRYGDKQVEVIKNPLSSDYQRLNKEVRDEFPGIGAGEVKTRFTVDENGNRYIWKASDAAHFQMEPEITKRFGVSVNQNNPESGNIDPALLAGMGGASAAAVAIDQTVLDDLDARIQKKRLRNAGQKYATLRGEGKGKWDDMRKQLMAFAQKADSLAGAALESIDIPMKGLHGIAAVAGDLAAGESLQDALYRGGTVAQQPIEQTAQQYGDTVFQATGSPAAGALTVGATNLAGF